MFANVPIVRIGAFWLIACTLVVVSGSAIAVEEAGENQIYALGSLHSKMLNHPHYTLPVFIQAIEQFHPDLILNEVRADHPGPADGCIDGGIEQGIVYAYGTVRKVPVVEVDWFDSDYDKRMESSNPKFEPAVQEKLEQLGTSYFKVFSKGTFDATQSKSTEDIVEQMYSVREENGDKLFRERNEHICSLIDKALAGKHGLKVLIVFGLDHKYFFDRYLSGEKNNKVLSITDWYKDGKAPKVASEIKDLSIQNLRASQKLLNDRLKTDYYTGAFKEKLTGKAKYFDRWIAKLESL